MVNLFSGNAVIAGALVETVIEVLFTIINSLLEFIINILTLGLGFVFRLMQLIFDNTLLDSVENAFSSFDPLVKAFVIIGYGLIALLFVFHAVRSMSAVDDSNIDTPGGLIMGMATAFLIVSAGIPVVKGVAIPFFRACNDGIIKVMDSISSGTVSLSAGTVSSGFLGLEDKIRAMFEAHGLFEDLNGYYHFAVYLCSEIHWVKVLNSIPVHSYENEPDFHIDGCPSTGRLYGSFQKHTANSVRLGKAVCRKPRIGNILTGLCTDDIHYISESTARDQHYNRCNLRCCQSVYRTGTDRLNSERGRLCTGTWA